VVESTFAQVWSLLAEPSILRRWRARAWVASLPSPAVQYHPSLIRQSPYPLASQSSCRAAGATSCAPDLFAHSAPIFHIAKTKMYTVWNVTFRIKTDNRGPCDPLYRMEPLTRGSVGDVDPFSDAFGWALSHAEDRLPFRYEQASSVTSDISDRFSLHSSMQDSPFTPNTVHSTFSQSDGRGSMGRQLPYLPISPNLDYYAGNTDYMTHPPTSAEELKSLQSTLSNLTAKLENEDENNPLLQPATSSVITLSEFKSKTKPSSDTKRKTKPCVKRKRKRKTPFLTTHRPPVKSREQHLSDNKAPGYLADAQGINRCLENRDQRAGERTGGPEAAALGVLRLHGSIYLQSWTQVERNHPRQRR
jgi:hypothetical protein